MAAPVIDKGNISNKINELQGQVAHWTAERDRAQGPKRRLAQTTLTYLEARLRWYRGRAEGKKPEAAFNTEGRKQTKASNQQRLVEARS